MDVKKNNMPFLQVNGLVVEYTSEGNVIHAVNEVSFRMDQGTTLGLVGETGAGKTSIAKAILRILPDVSSKIRSGEVWFEGTDLLSLKESEMEKVRGQKISMIFQDPMTALNPVKKVGDQIAEGLRIHNRKLSRTKAREEAEEMLNLVGIPKERYDEYPHQFSGGMKQRVVIAMALACKPTLLLADEPTTALDVTIQAQVMDMIKELRDKLDTSMILITHDLGVVAETCDDVAVVYAGEIVEYGSLREIFKEPSHPYTQGLFDALPNLESDEEWLKPIMGLPPDPTNLPLGCKFAPRCPYASEKCSGNAVKLHKVSGKHVCRCIKYEMEVEA